jgi:hypothetical protein
VIPQYLTTPFQWWYSSVEFLLICVSSRQLDDHLASKHFQVEKLKHLDKEQMAGWDQNTVARHLQQ